MVCLLQVDVSPWHLNFEELEIVRPCGEGSFGRVYQAVWHQSPVAVKVG